MLKFIYISLFNERLSATRIQYLRLLLLLEDLLEINVACIWIVTHL